MLGAACWVLGKDNDIEACPSGLLPRPSSLAPRPSGFTYIGLLIAIALMGMALAGTGLVWHAESRRLKERELLFVGEQYRRAIGLYYEHSPGEKKFPRSVDDLLLDARFPVVQRYLRRAYADPLTGTQEWGIVDAPGGGIAGVFSLSEGRPVKRTHFGRGQAEFEERETYREWRFVYVPQEAPDGGPAQGRRD